MDCPNKSGNDETAEMVVARREIKKYQNTNNAI